MADGHFPVPEQDEGQNACGCRTLVSSGSSASLGKAFGGRELGRHQRSKGCGKLTPAPGTAGA